MKTEQKKTRTPNINLASNLITRLLPFCCAVVLLLAVLTGCGNTEAKARKELASLGKQFVAEDLLDASADGDKYAVDLFLKAGMDVNVQNQKGYSALYLAATRGKTEVIKLLLGKGAKPDLPAVDGVTPLICAAWNGHSEAVKLLLEKGAKPNLQDESGMTALYFAASAFKGDHPDIVKLLLSSGADINVTTEDGSTALDAAIGELLPVMLTLSGTEVSETVTGGQKEVIQLLRKKGA